MKWMAGWLLYCTSICRLTGVHSSRGVFDVTSARANRTLQVQSERNRIADESTWRGRMAWAWFRSIPYRCRAHRPWWWRTYIVILESPDKEIPYFPFAPPAMSIRFVPFLFNFFRLTYHHCLCQKQLPVNFNVTLLLRACSVCIVHVIILLIRPLPILESRVIEGRVE